MPAYKVYTSIVISKIQLKISGIDDKLIDRFYCDGKRNDRTTLENRPIRRIYQKHSSGSIDQIRVVKDLMDNRNCQIEAFEHKIGRAYPNMTKKLRELLIRSTNDKNIDQILSQSKYEKIKKLRENANKYIREFNVAKHKRNVFANYGKWYLQPKSFKKPHNDE